MAVYTDVSDEDLAAFLADYAIGDMLSLRGVAEGVENSNFLLHTTTGYYFLTLYEKRVDERDLPFFLGLLEHLAARGLTCPQPIRNRNGEALGRLSERAAAIVTFLDGMWPRKPSPAHCAHVGAALASLHKAGADFPLRRANALSVESWPRLFDAVRDRADSVQPGLSSFVADELAFLAGAWPKALPKGIIHADLFPDNVLFLGKDLSGLIDFYFACEDFYAYDLAICLNAWCFEYDHSFNFTKGAALIDNYRRGRAMNADELNALPVLARGAAMRFMLTRLVDWLNRPEGALVKPKDPLEYFRKLRFHQRVESLRDYGAGA